MGESQSVYMYFHPHHCMHSWEWPSLVSKLIVAWGESLGNTLGPGVDCHVQWSQHTQW